MIQLRFSISIVQTRSKQLFSLTLLVESLFFENKQEKENHKKKTEMSSPLQQPRPGVVDWSPSPSSATYKNYPFYSNNTSASSAAGGGANNISKKQVVATCLDDGSQQGGDRLQLWRIHVCLLMHNENRAEGCDPPIEFTLESGRVPPPPMMSNNNGSDYNINNNRNLSSTGTDMMTMMTPPQQKLIIKNDGGDETPILVSSSSVASTSLMMTATKNNNNAAKKANLLATAGGGGGGSTMLRTITLSPIDDEAPSPAPRRPLSSSLSLSSSSAAVATGWAKNLPVKRGFVGVTSSLDSVAVATPNNNSNDAAAAAAAAISSSSLLSPLTPPTATTTMSTYSSSRHTQQQQQQQLDLTAPTTTATTTDTCSSTSQKKILSRFSTVLDLKEAIVGEYNRCFLDKTTAKVLCPDAFCLVFNRSVIPDWPTALMGSKTLADAGLYNDALIYAVEFDSERYALREVLATRLVGQTESRRKAELERVGRMGDDVKSAAKKFEELVEEEAFVLAPNNKMRVQVNRRMKGQQQQQQQQVGGVGVD